MEFTETLQSIKIKQFFMLVWIFKLFNHGFQMEHTFLASSYLSLASCSEEKKKEAER